MKNPIKTLQYFWKSITNIIRWFPIIWKDRDWDHTFIFNILKFKLQNQAEYISENDNHTTAQNDAKWMRICCKLIDKINNDYYEMEYMEGWPDNQLPAEVIFKRYPRQYKIIISEIKNSETIYGRESIIDDLNDTELISLLICIRNHERARKLLFDILNNNIEKWWD